MRILVLGGYGLVGSSIIRHLLEQGHDVTGLGRSVTRVRRTMPTVRWIAHDLTRLATAADWLAVLRDAGPEAIVNCAGALQDGVRDDVAAVQHRAIAALVAAMPAAGVSRFVQISAPGAGEAGRTLFMRSKGEADAAVAASTVDWVILRPGLVLAPEAYGGSAVLRALAAVPWVQPIAFADAQLQTVGAEDIARAVAAVLADQVPSRQIYDLVEDEAHTMRDVVAAMRGWLGLAPAVVIEVPAILVRGVGLLADGLGRLGWRSPLRTTALTELARGVTGDPSAWRRAAGPAIAPLTTTLRRLPSTVQERWFARSYFLKPAAIGVLAAFWLLSGIIALLQFDAASQVLLDRGLGHGTAAAIVAGGALVDIGLGLAILVHATMRTAALGMIAVTLAYLAGATLLAPGLWLDPIGPLLKTLPAAMLAVVVLALAEER